MSSYSIITDTGCDMPAALAQKLDISAVPLKVTIGSKTFDSTLSKLDIGNVSFYDMLRNGVDVKTASPSIDDYERYFKKELEKGKDVLYIGFSSGLSGAYNVSRIAAEELRGEYPERKILTVDSLCGSMGLSLLVYYCVQKQRDGASLEEVREFAENTKRNVCHWFTVDTFTHLKHGGRVSGAAAAMGTALQIKPLLHVDSEGKLQAVEKPRGRKKAVTTQIARMEQGWKPELGKSILIGHADDPEAADMLKERLLEQFPDSEICIAYIGPIIGAHTGPGALALIYWGNNR